MDQIDNPIILPKNLDSIVLNSFVFFFSKLKIKIYKYKKSSLEFENPTLFDCSHCE